MVCVFPVPVCPLSSWKSIYISQLYMDREYIKSVLGVRMREKDNKSKKRNILCKDGGIVAIQHSVDATCIVT